MACGLWSDGLIIVGTDTGVGKTQIAAALLLALRSRGLDALPMKPVQTGAVDDRAPDLDFCLQAAGLSCTPERYAQLSPYRFPLAASPHLAARHANARIEMERVFAAVRSLRQAGHPLIIEAAGGLFVPWTEEQLQLEILCELDLPFVLVARPGLGTLNHTLLSVEALRRRGVRLVAVALNEANPAWGLIEEDNLRTLAEWIPEAPVVRTRHLSEPNSDALLEMGLHLLDAIGERTGGEHLALERPVPKSDSALDRVAEWVATDRAHVWHPYTRASQLEAQPIPIIVRGEGIYLFAADGRRYVDAIASWWCAALGHSHPRVVSAIRRQAAMLQHSILANLTHPQAIQLADRLARLMPTPDRYVLFASDGASAVEQALKMAVQYWHNVGRPEKHRFACLHGAYHGDTLGAMAVGYLAEWHRPFKPLLADAVPIRLEELADGAWRARLDRLSAGLAAVIVEPLCLGAAGMRMYPAAALRDMAEWCQSRQVLLIDDEIAMGFGRTGRMFAFEHAGIDPDLVCVGKALSGGTLPISATIARSSLYATFTDRPTDRTLQHGHTFCGNPIAAAAANAALQLYEELGIAERAAALGARMHQALEPLRGSPGVADVRCLGLIGAVELSPETDSPAIPRPHRIRLRLQEQGILLRPLGRVLYLMPPLVISERELDDLTRAFVEAIRAELR